MASLTISQKTGAELVIYPSNSDAIAFKDQGNSGESSTNDPRGLAAQLVSLTTAKAMGATGTWSTLLKVPRSKHRAFERSFSDGDWADIVFTTGSRRYHVMRGIIGALEPANTVTASGADTFAYTLSGFDHQAVFESTPIWFSTFSEENIAGGASLNASALLGNPFGLGGVRDTITAFLFGFLAEVNKLGRATWVLPASMPNGGGSPFAAACARLFDQRVDDPKRISVGASHMSFGNSFLWDLATQWAEPQFNELWCDLARAEARTTTINGDVIDALGGETQPPEGLLLSDGNAFGPDQTAMGVFLRRRPFPTDVDAGGLEFSPWASLPTATILPQEIRETQALRRSGDERKNVIEVSTATIPEIAANAVSLIRALADRADVEKRGVRLLTMATRYQADLSSGVSGPDLVNSMRDMLRDWHCLNPEFFSGTIPLATLRPGIRVGMVACVTPNPERLRGEEAANDFTAYVESVTHTKRAGSAGRTQIGVTRGFYGGDDAFYEALRTARARWLPLEPSRAGGG